MSHASRFALIAALACRGVSTPVSITYPVPSRCQGSRMGVEPILSPTERSQCRAALAQARAEREAAHPVNFVLVG